MRNHLLQRVLCIAMIGALVAGCADITPLPSQAKPPEEKNKPENVRIVEVPVKEPVQPEVTIREVRLLGLYLSSGSEFATSVNPAPFAGGSQAAPELIRLAEPWLPPVKTTPRLSRPELE